MRPSALPIKNKGKIAFRVWKKVLSSWREWSGLFSAFHQFWIHLTYYNRRYLSKDRVNSINFVPVNNWHIFVLKPSLDSSYTSLRSISATHTRLCVQRFEWCLIRSLLLLHRFACVLGYRQVGYWSSSPSARCLHVFLCKDVGRHSSCHRLHNTHIHDTSRMVSSSKARKQTSLQWLTGYLILVCYYGSRNTDFVATKLRNTIS